MEEVTQEDGSDGNEVFMSFTDVSMLLLVFFIYMYSISSINTNEIEKMSQSIKESLGFESAEKVTIDDPESTAVYQEINPEDTQLDNEQMIVLQQDVLFKPGSAVIKDAGIRYLQKIAEILQSRDVFIMVEGHTDNSPINTIRFPSNWHLSAVRASAVCKIFEESGIPSSRLKAVGYGQSRPMMENIDEASRKANRRVELYLKPLEEVK